MTETIVKYETNMPGVVHEKSVNVAGPLELAQSFLQNGGDLANLEKMMDLQDRFEKKEAEKLFFVAMANAQKEMPVILEGRANAQTRSKYAAYKDIVRGSKPIYTKFGLAVSFYEGETADKDYVKLCADVYHESGHSKTYSVNLPIDDKGPKGTPVKTKIHGLKSSMSYGRGILLGNIFNIPTNDDIDDDGNGAGKKIQNITEQQVSTIVDMINSTETDETAFLKWIGAESVDAIQMPDFNKCLAALKAKVKK